MFLRSLKSVLAVTPQIFNQHLPLMVLMTHLGLAFDKLNPYNSLANCDAIFETFNFPNGMTVLTQEDTMLSKL